MDLSARLAALAAIRPSPADLTAAAVDLDTEYDMRARLAEHPQVLARWEKDAAAWRDARRARAEIALAYGPSPRQTLDLFHPDAAGRSPIAMLIHGGEWRALSPALFSHLAAGLNAHGITVAVAGYDLC